MSDLSVVKDTIDIDALSLIEYTIRFHLHQSCILFQSRIPFVIHPEIHYPSTAFILLLIPFSNTVKLISRVIVSPRVCYLRAYD